MLAILSTPPPQSSLPEVPSTAEIHTYPFDVGRSCRRCDPLDRDGKRPRVRVPAKPQSRSALHGGHQQEPSADNIASAALRRTLPCFPQSPSPPGNQQPSN